VNKRYLGLAAGFIGLAVMPVSAMASTTTTDTLQLSAGTLSISGMSTWTSAATAVSAGTLSSGTNSATWSDLTGLGLGWNGTLALESFIYQGSWTSSSGTANLTSTASGAYTGAVAEASITVTVTGTPTAASTPFTCTDDEAGTFTSCAANSPAANGVATTLANGMTINFKAATTQTVGTVYTVQMGVLQTTALKLTTASGSVTAQAGTAGGSNLPSLINNNTTVSSTSATSYGTAVKFVQAQALTGIGNFTVVPGVTITWDANNTWAANFVANAQYTIASGP
jgi:hypothetical protein